MMNLSRCDAEMYATLATKDVTGNTIQPPSTDQKRCCLALQLKTPSTTTGRFSVKTFELESIQESITIWNPACTDVLGPIKSLGATYAYNNLLEGSVVDAVALTCPPGGSSNCSTVVCPKDRPLFHKGECVVPLCSNIKKYCFDDSAAGIRARQFCSETCGCADPTSQLVLAGEDFGCPVNCPHTPTYSMAVGKLACMDVPPGSPSLVAWADEVTRVSGTWPLNWADGAPRFVNSIVADGCWAASSNSPVGSAYGLDWCKFGGTFWPIKPISYMCPVTCGCAKAMRSGGKQWGCPTSCGATHVNESSHA